MEPNERKTKHAAGTQIGGSITYYDIIVSAKQRSYEKASEFSGHLDLMAGCITKR